MSPFIAYEISRKMKKMKKCCNTNKVDTEEPSLEQSSAEKIGWKSFLLLLILSFVFLGQSRACTSVIVSGKVTRDGRPLLFKNRDTPNVDNLSLLVQGEKYKYLAIVRADNLEPGTAWGGHNETGFAIINTAAFNLNGPDEKDSPNDGLLMGRALEICSTLEDFEQFLDTLSRPMGVNSNFGAIDAKGGCAYYETGNEKYTKFDANDPKVAPDGYLIRTNYAFTGDRSLDQGIERFMAITEFMQQADYTGNITCEHLLLDIPRHLKHGLTKMDLYDFIPADETQMVMFPFRDFIPRYTTSSTLLVQGIRPGENPLLTVSWTIVGSPLTTVAIPLCITSSGKLPSVVTSGKDGGSKLCRMGLELKKNLFPPTRSRSKGDYINLSKLMNKSGTGMLQKILPIEKEIMIRGNRALDKIREQGKSRNEMDDYYLWVDQYIIESYQKIFGLN